MKRNIKLFLIDWLVAAVIIAIGFCISKTFLCGTLCGALYCFITELIEIYLRGKEEK